MDDSDRGEYLAECFWPGVNETDLEALDQRARAAVAESSRGGAEVRYLGSLLMGRDEVVFCCFEGSEHSVRGAAERAKVPFERILAVTHSPWHSIEADGPVKSKHGES